MGSRRKFLLIGGTGARTGFGGGFGGSIGDWEWGKVWLPGWMTPGEWCLLDIRVGLVGSVTFA